MGGSPELVIDAVRKKAREKIIAIYNVGIGADLGERVSAEYATDVIRNITRAPRYLPNPLSP